MYVGNSVGRALQSRSIGVARFFSMIFSYFSFFETALTPCQGNCPFAKYNKTYPMDSKSSRRLCSIPRCVLILAYRAVPVKVVFSLYGLCSIDLAFRKRFE